MLSLTHTMADHPILALVAVAAIALFGWWMAFAQPQVTKKALRHIPELGFDENDTPERYLVESKSLLRKGYEKYLRHGVAVQMRNPIGELGPQLILPMKYLDEVKNAPTSLFSFKLFSEKSFLLNYINGPQQTDAAAHVVRVDLTRSLGALSSSLHAEAIAALDETIPKARGWTSVPGYQLIISAVSRVTALALVGPELCRNPEWLQLSVQTTVAVFGAANAVRDNYSPRWRWLARWKDPAPKRILGMRKKAASLLAPLYKERMGAQKQENTFQDGLQWLLRLKSAGKSLDRIADQQLFLTIASIHTTSGTLTSILFDLLTHPEDRAEIVEEIKQVAAENDGHWTLQSVAKLRKLDSFMKESQRFNALGLITAQRLAVKPYTFKDGLHIPAGVIFQFPSDAVHHDGEFYPDPERFDSQRFLRLRETIDPNRFHFASVSDTSLSFGAGTHACPGRFFSALVIKFILISLLTGYDMQFAEGDGRRPPDMFHDFTMIPNMAAEIKLRRK